MKVSECTKTLRAGLKAAEESIKARRADVPEVARLIAKISRVHDRYANKMTLSGVSVSAGTYGLYCSFNAYNVGGFKDRAIEKLLADLDAILPFVQTYDYAGSLNRDFVARLMKPNGNIKFEFRLSVYVKEDSPTCLRVIKGYTEPTAPEPIYELQCL